MIVILEKRLWCGVYLLLLLLLVPTFSFSQYNFWGKVIDNTSHAPIPFVSVTIPGTYWGTITNADGKFSLKIPTAYPNKNVVFSCVGYKTDTIAMTNIHREIIIKLEEKINELSEIIVMYCRAPGTKFL